ncbi:MAG: protein kinase [Planctomycetaceae bacterium]|nr:protein kinase [Planctomycetaceae bacterium]
MAGSAANPDAGDSETFERAGALFAEACELPEVDRVAFARERAAGDAALLAQVLQLLEGDQRGFGYLDAGAAPLAARLLHAKSFEEAPTAAPDRIGPYRIVRPIGEGSMGLVFEAEQEHPRRHVALKLLRTNPMRPDRARRFQREIDVLARLDHPGIARIFGAGVSDDGLPYFAMELVEGDTLTQHVRATRPALEEQLHLVAQLCDALEHAHQRGIVHRDLKPANVLVDGSGAPKVLDFGIASAAADGRSDGTLMTEAGTVLGTLSYMSPEQARADGRAVDRRSDVYSLGVLLYELVTGVLPLPLDGMPIHEALRTLVEDDVPPLSAHRRDLGRDLETIVQRALEKDPNRRYPSAAAFAADLRHWMANEPIAARPATTFYRASKFVRRHRGLVVGVSAAFVVLVVATVLLAWQAQRATEASQRAREEARRAQFQTYLAAIQGAEAALAIGDLGTASALLASAPADRRGWEWRQLLARLDTSARVEHLPAAALALRTRGDGAVLALLADGSLLAFSDDLAEQRVERELEGAPFVLAALSPKGSAAVTADAAGQLVLHDLVAHTSTSEGAIEGLIQLAVADGAAAFGALTRSKVAYFGVRGGGGPTQTPWLGRHGLAFAPDGDRLLAGSPFGEVLEWSHTTQGERRLFGGDPSDIRWLASSVDGERMAAGHLDRRVFVFDRDGSTAPLGPFLGNVGQLEGIELSSDGRHLATAGGDGLVRAFDLLAPGSTEWFVGQGGEFAGLAFGAAGDRLLSIGSDRTLRLWLRGDDHRSSVLRGHGSWVYPVVFAPDGEQIFSGAWDASVRRWGGARGEARGVLHQLDDEQAVLSLALSPDGKLLAVGRRHGQPLLLDAATGELLAELSTPLPHTTEALAFDNTGRRLAAFRFDGRVHSAAGRMALFDVRERRLLADCELSSDGRGPVRFAPSGGRLFVLASAHLVVYDAEDGRELARVPAERGGASLAFSDDGSLLASGHASGRIALWDPESLEERGELRGHRGVVYALAFHPDESRLASGARDGQILLWDMSDGTRVARLVGHTNYVYSLAFSPDGSRLVSGSGDGTLRLWDTVPRHQR